MRRQRVLLLWAHDQGSSSNAVWANSDYWLLSVSSIFFNVDLEIQNSLRSRTRCPKNTAPGALSTVLRTQNPCFSKNCHRAELIKLKDSSRQRHPIKPVEGLTACSLLAPKLYAASAVTTWAQGKQPCEQEPCPKDPRLPLRLVPPRCPSGGWRHPTLQRWQGTASHAAQGNASRQPASFSCSLRILHSSKTETNARRRW